MIEAILRFLRAYKAAALVALTGALALGISAGGYLAYAERCHAQSLQNQRDIEQLIEYQRQQIERERSKEQLKEKLREQLRQLCLAGTVKDKAECARVGVAIKE